MLEELQNYPSIIKMCHTGSREICNPPPMNTDDDWLVLIAPDGKEHFLNWFEAGDLFAGAPGYENSVGGWQVGGSHVEGRESEFTSLKKNDVNIIMTTDPAFYQYFEAATTVAKKLNLLDKQDRIMLFNAVMNGKKYEELSF